MMPAQIGEDLFAIHTRMPVASPGIQGPATSTYFEFGNGLTKSAVRNTRERAQFNHHARPQDVDQKHSEWYVGRPGG